MQNISNLIKNVITHDKRKFKLIFNNYKFCNRVSYISQVYHQYSYTQKRRLSVNNSNDTDEDNIHNKNIKNESILLKKCKSYANLGRYWKQTGTFLLFWPCAHGVALASIDPLNASAMSLYFLYFWGAFHLRSAGCAINDWWDSDFDKKVERTKNRPIANGELTSNEGIAFALAHC